MTDGDATVGAPLLGWPAGGPGDFGVAGLALQPPVNSADPYLAADCTTVSCPSRLLQGNSVVRFRDGLLLARMRGVQLVGNAAQARGGSGLKALGTPELTVVGLDLTTEGAYSSYVEHAGVWLLPSTDPSEPLPSGFDLIGVVVEPGFERGVVVEAGVGGRLAASQVLGADAELLVLEAEATGWLIADNLFGVPDDPAVDDVRDDGAGNTWSGALVADNPGSNVLGGVCLGGNAYTAVPGVTASGALPEPACAGEIAEPRPIPGAAGSVDAYPLLMVP